MIIFRWISLIGFLVILALAYATIRMYGSPRLEVNSQYMFDNIAATGNTVNVEIPLRNAGHSVLNIVSVKAGCSCLEVQYPKVIKSGEVLPLKVSYNYSNKPQGLQRELLVIESNDRNNPTKTTSAVFAVPGKWLICPEEIILSGKAGQGIRKSIQILNLTGRKGDIEFSDSKPYFRMSVTANPRHFNTINADCYTVNIDAVAPAINSSIEDDLSFSINDGTKKRAIKYHFKLIGTK